MVVNVRKTRPTYSEKQKRAGFGCHCLRLLMRQNVELYESKYAINNH